jgi:membrane carboxypeptidase/penicillin-binding protein PbpC
MTLKLIILAIIFIITGGAVFSKLFQKHKFLIVLASLMTIISSYFLLKDIISIFDDEINPTGEVLNIKLYYEGDEVKYSIKASDNKALSSITFSIEDTTVKETWAVSGKEFNEQSSFSTKGWQTQKNYKYLLTVVDKAGNTFKKESSFLLENNAECVLFNNKC